MNSTNTQELNIPLEFIPEFLMQVGREFIVVGMKPWGKWSL